MELTESQTGSERKAPPHPTPRVVEEPEQLALFLLLPLSPQGSCASRARHVLIQDAEDKDPEDSVSRNSYPVYLMEQQNLKPNQIPSPP